MNTVSTKRHLRIPLNKSWQTISQKVLKYIVYTDTDTIILTFRHIINEYENPKLTREDVLENNKK